MIATITSSTYDINGAVQLKLDRNPSDFQGNVARATRTPTLDGAAVIVHSGTSDSDRVIRLVSVPGSLTDSDAALIEHFFSTYMLHVCSCQAGVFLGVISTRSVKNGMADITFLPREKLS